MKLTVGNKGQQSDVGLINEYGNRIGSIFSRGDAEEIARASERSGARGEGNGCRERSAVYC
jgi:hypothetical protein